MKEVGGLFFLLLYSHPVFVLPFLPGVHGTTCGYFLLYTNFSMKVIQETQSSLDSQLLECLLEK